MMNKGLLGLGVILIVVIAGVVAGAVYWSQMDDRNNGVEESGSQGISNDTTLPLEQRLAPDTLPEDAETGFGDQPSQMVETAILVAQPGYTGSGTATRSFDGTTFNHEIVAQIGDPAEGKFYEGWLVMPTATGPKFFSTGKLEKAGAIYALSWTDDQNYPDHTLVVVTEETTANGLDNQPEDHVIEGSFQS